MNQYRYVLYLHEHDKPLLEKALKAVVDEKLKQGQWDDDNGETILLLSMFNRLASLEKTFIG